MLALQANIIIICVGLLFVSRSAFIAKYIECEDRAGGNPETFDVYSRTSCSSGFTPVSCGASVIGGGNGPLNQILGSYIDGNKCVAASYCNLCGNVQGVRTYARCCNISPAITIDIQPSSISGTNDNDDRSYTCNNNGIMIGCNAKDEDGWGNIASETWFDGLYIGDKDNPSSTDTQNRCTVNNGDDGNGVYAQGVCVDTSTIMDVYSLECNKYYGAGVSQPASSIVTCPDDGTNWFILCRLQMGLRF